MNTSFLILSIILLALVQIKLADGGQGNEITPEDDEYVMGNDEPFDKYTNVDRTTVLGKLTGRIRALRGSLASISPLRRIFVQRQIFRLESLYNRFSRGGSI